MKQNDFTELSGYTFLKNYYENDPPDPTSDFPDFHVNDLFAKMNSKINFQIFEVFVYELLESPADSQNELRKHWVTNNGSVFFCFFVAFCG